MQPDLPILSEDHLQRLADIAKVPNENREWFSQRMQSLATMAWQRGVGWVAPPIVSAELVEGLSRVHRAATELRSALDSLDGRAAGWIETFGPSRPDAPDEDRHIFDYRDEVSILVEASGRAGNFAQSQMPGRGAPSRDPGDPGFSAFDLLVYGVLNAVSVAGGKVTHNKNREVAAGTLAKFLHCLGSALPAGLVPRALPLPRLQRAKSEWMKNRDSMR